MNKPKVFLQARLSQQGENSAMVIIHYFFRQQLLFPPVVEKIDIFHINKTHM